MFERSFCVLTAPDFSKLHLAAAKGNLSSFKALLQGRPNVNIQTSKKITPLHVASQQGHLQIVKLLVENGANLNSKTDEGFTSLHLAIQQSQLQVSEFLIKAGADVNICDNQKWTPLHNVCFNGFSLAIVKALLEHGSNVNAVNNDRRTALHLASKLNHIEIVKYLIESGADINAVDDMHYTPLLHSVTEASHLKVVKVLLENGAKVNRDNGQGWTPLHFAAEAGEVEIFKLLLKYGADVDFISDQDGTALHLAVQYGHLTLVNLLIQHECDVNSKVYEHTWHPIDHLGKSWTPEPGMLLPVCFPFATPLHLAAMGGDIQIVKLLLNAGAFYNAKATAGVCSLPLDFAKVKGDTKTIQLLQLVDRFFNAATHNLNDKIFVYVKEGVTVNARESTDGRSALHCIICHGNIDATKMLLQNKADFTQTTNKNITTLHFAVGTGKYEVVEVLVQFAVKELKPIKLFSFLHVRTAAEDSTALHLAAFKSSVKIVKLLLNSGAIYNIKNKAGIAPSDIATTLDVKNIFDSVDSLFVAAKAGDKEKVKKLLSKDKEIVNARDNQGGATSLYWAVHNGHIDTVKILIDNGADPTFITRKGNTPLHIASSKGNSRAVKLLLQSVKSDSAKLNILVNSQTTVGRMSALHIASTLDVAKTLLQHGAVYNMKNKDEKTPVDLATGDIKNLLELTNSIFEDTKNGDPAIADKLKELKPDVLEAVASAQNEQVQETMLQISKTNLLKHQSFAKELSALMKRCN